MFRLLTRILISFGVAAILAFIGIKGNATVLQTLFTVLGIVFSISMSLLVSFSLSKILNIKIRNNIRYKITHTCNMLLFDFGVSTTVLVIALLWKENSLQYEISSWCIIDIMLTSVVIVAMSLVYEIYNFRKLHKLHTDIEDALISEEMSRSKH